MTTLSHYHEKTPEGPSNRKFGLVLAGVCGVIGIWLWIKTGRFAILPWAAGAGLVGVSLFVPSSLQLFNRAWMKLGELLHRAVSPLVLGLMFFGVITPLGIVLRLIRKRPIDVEFDCNAVSYWKPRDQSGPTDESLRNQF